MRSALPVTHRPRAHCRGQRGVPERPSTESRLRSHKITRRSPRCWDAPRGRPPEGTITVVGPARKRRGLLALQDRSEAGEADRSGPEHAVPRRGAPVAGPSDGPIYRPPSDDANGLCREGSIALLAAAWSWDQGMSAIQPVIFVSWRRFKNGDCDLQKRDYLLISMVIIMLREKILSTSVVQCSALQCGTF